MVILSNLPDLILLNIFLRLPLAQLLSNLKLLFPNRKELHRSARFQRKQLVLIGDEVDLELAIRKLYKQANPVGSESIFKALLDAVDVDDSTWAWAPPMSLIKLNVIKIKLDDTLPIEQMTTSLLDRFTGITHLTVCLGWNERCDDKVCSNLKQLIRIINKYANRLVTLKLDLDYADNCYFDCESVVKMVQALFGSINRIGSQLKHLTLNVRLEGAKLIDSDYNFAFLERVQTFATNQFRVTRKPEKLLLFSLAEHAIGGVCSQIDIGTGLGVKDVNKLDPKLTVKFRHLTVRLHFSYWDSNETIDQQMRLFAEQFVSLSSLEVQVCKMPLTRIARNLSGLTGLFHLNLNFETDFPQFEKEDTESGPLVMTQLPSVRLFTLNVTLPTHSDMEKLLLGAIFPQLQVLRYESLLSECKQCEIRNPKISTIYLQVMKVRKAKCVRLTLQAFPSLIPSLHLVEYKPEWALEGNSNVPHEGLHDLDKLLRLVDAPDGPPNAPTFRASKRRL